MTADDDDDNSDSWQLKSPASDNEFKIGVWTGARYTERFAVTPAGAATFNNAFKFPTADGTADQVLKTNGAGTVAWGDAASNVVDVAPSAQDEYSGMMVATVTAGSTINKHAPVYLSSDGKWDHADADSISTMAYAFSLEASTLNSTFKIALPPGIIINNTSGWAWTVGDTLFLGTTAGSGGIVGSSSKPSASGDIVQRLGFALTADIAYIFTNFTTVEIV